MSKKIWSHLAVLTLLWGASRDLDIFLGADALAHGEFQRAREIYSRLYEDTKDVAYARQLAIAYATLGDLSNAFQYAFLYQNITKDTKDLPTSKIIADSYIRQGDIQKAIVLLQSIQKQEPSPEVDNILGTLYLNQKQFDKALELLDSYYQASKDEEALKKILTIYFLQNRNDKVIARLAEHLNEKMCSEDLCNKAIDIFNQFDRNEEARKIFSRYYKENPTIQNAKYYLKVLVNQRHFVQAEKIVKAYPFDRRLLLDLYVMQNKFQQASFQAQKIYEENKEVKYLAWSAVYAYQAQDNPNKKIDKNTLDEVIKKLSQAIASRDAQRKIDNEDPNNEDAFFYNFLGYVLVEHDIDIKRGIVLIKRALSIAPHSLAYIDSLAWGHYKLGDCLQAQSVFSNIPKDKIFEDAELRFHFESIRKCHQK